MRHSRPFLLVVLKSLNFILLLAGLLTLFHAWRLFKDWTDGEFVTSPSASQSHHFTSGLLDSVASQAAENDRSLQSGLDLSAGDSSVGNYKDSFDWPEIDWNLYLSLPWIIYATSGFGAFMVMVAISGGYAHVPRCLSFNQNTLALLLFFEGAVATFIYFDNTWERDLPEDRTGEIQRAKEFILANFSSVKWTALVFLMVEVLALIVSSTLVSTTIRYRQVHLVHPIQVASHRIFLSPSHPPPPPPFLPRPAYPPQDTLF